MPQTALEYQRLTDYERDRMKGAGLDWAHQPRTYKVYEGLETIPLHRDFQCPQKSLRSLYDPQMGRDFTGRLSLVSCAPLLFLAYGLTARRRGLGEDFFFRSVPSAGALYPGEIYLGAWNIEGIPPGLYHFDTVRNALTLIRAGDFRPPFGKGSSESPLDADADAAFWVSGIFFRSSWKYRERAYRYVLMDAGHLVENLVLALDAFSLPCTVSLDFNDEKALLLMGFDPQKEACLAQIALHGSAAPRKKKPLSLPPLGSEVAAASCVSTREALFPEIIDIHRAGYVMRTGGQSGGSMQDALGIHVARWNSLPSSETRYESPPFAQCALNRRSHRNFIPKAITKASFDRLIDLLTAASSAHRAQPPYEAVLSCGFLIHAVEGLDPGFYMLDAAGNAMGAVRFGVFADRMASVCLDQEWLKLAAVHFLFLTNIGVLDRQWGVRGYRYAMIAAGRLGQAVYLGCTALGLGCCGIGALYDGEAQALLGLNPDAALLYLVAAGNVRKMP